MRENPVFSRVLMEFVRKKEQKIVGPNIHCSPVLTRTYAVCDRNELPSAWIEIKNFMNWVLRLMNCTLRCIVMAIQFMERSENSWHSQFMTMTVVNSFKISVSKLYSLYIMKNKEIFYNYFNFNLNGVTRTGFWIVNFKYNFVKMLGNMFSPSSLTIKKDAVFHECRARWVRVSGGYPRRK